MKHIIVLYLATELLQKKSFWRLCTLWTLFASKWRWSETYYDNFFKIGVALTNLHIKKNPLRTEDEKSFARTRNHLAHIAREKQQKRQDALNRYRERRRIRVNYHFRCRQFPARSHQAD